MLAVDANKKFVSLIVSLVLFMDALDSTIINTAVPTIARSLAVAPVNLKIALISYLMSMAIFIPISGWIADKYGVRTTFIIAVTLFTISSFWCGFAETLFELILGRSIQGIGGALMLPIGRLIILRTFGRSELVRAMNSIAMIVSLGVMLGPVAGGFITYHLSWSWIFWMNIPIGIIAILMAIRHLVDFNRHNVPPFDFLGFIFFGCGLATLTFSLSYFSETTTKIEIAWIILALSITLLTLYVFHSRKTPHPIVDPSIFKFRTFRIAVLGNLFARLGFGGMPFLLPLLFQIVFGFTSELSGLLIAPIAIGIIITKAVILDVLRYLGYKKTLLINTVLVGIALIFYVFIKQSTPLYLIALFTMCYGTLLSLQFGSLNSIAYADIPDDKLSAASSVLSTTQQLTQSFGVAIAALLLKIHTPKEVSGFLLTPQVFHSTFISLSVMTIISSLLFLRLKNEDGKSLLTDTTKKDRIVIN